MCNGMAFTLPQSPCLMIGELPFLVEGLMTTLTLVPATCVPEMPGAEGGTSAPPPVEVGVELRQQGLSAGWRSSLTVQRQ